MNDSTSTMPDTDQVLRDRTVRVLQAGFRIAVALLAIGLLLAVIRQEALPHELGSPGEIAGDIGDLSPAGFLGLGIAAVILTPLAATIAIALTFGQRGDRRYALISGTVVLVLLVSVSLSLL